MTPSSDEPLSTGLKGLDRIIEQVTPGDNFVWQVDSVADYRLFVRLLIRYARRRRPLTYFRFAQHAPLITQDEYYA